MVRALAPEDEAGVLRKVSADPGVVSSGIGLGVEDDEPGDLQDK
jgi:hypothetical protein